MAEFDNVLAEAQKQMAALKKVLDNHPNILKEAQKARDDEPDPKVVEEKAQDDARANALKNLLAQSPLTAVEEPLPDRETPDTDAEK